MAHEYDSAQVETLLRRLEDTVASLNSVESELTSLGVEVRIGQYFSTSPLHGKYTVSAKKKLL